DFVGHARQGASRAGFRAPHPCFSSARITAANRYRHALSLLVEGKRPDYPAAFDKAKEIACDAAEDEVWRREFTGIEKPLSYQGKLTGDKIREYADLLAMFWLKGARPAKYREDSRVQINVNVPPAVNILLACNRCDGGKHSSTG